MMKYGFLLRCALTIFLGLAASMATALPPQGTPYEQDPGEPCASETDPFCETEPGGGGGSGTCYHCATKYSETFHFTTAQCCTGSCWLQWLAGYRISGDGTGCTVKTQTGSSNQYCELQGACSNLVGGTSDRDEPIDPNTAAPSQ